MIQQGPFSDTGIKSSYCDCAIGKNFRLRCTAFGTLELYNAVPSCTTLYRAIAASRALLSRTTRFGFRALVAAFLNSIGLQ